MKTISLLFLLFTCCSLASAFDFWKFFNYPSATAISEIDLRKYSGQWYEVARLPFYFERNCYCSMAHYEFDPKGTLHVKNICTWKSPEGELHTASGEAVPVEPLEEGSAISNGNFKVSLFEVISVPYVILAVDKNYDYAMVGSPRANKLWILSRKPSLDDKIYYQLIDEARSQGFDVTNIIKTYQGPACDRKRLMSV